MGLLLKIILFGLVFYYVFKTIGSIVFRMLGGQAQRDQNGNTARQKKRGEINIDYIPKEKKGKHDSKEDEYIDYEEVK